MKTAIRDSNTFGGTSVLLVPGKCDEDVTYEPEGDRRSAMGRRNGQIKGTRFHRLGRCRNPMRRPRSVEQHRPRNGQDIRNVEIANASIRFFFSILPNIILRLGIQIQQKLVPLMFENFIVNVTKCTAVEVQGRANEIDSTTQAKLIA